MPACHGLQKRGRGPGIGMIGKALKKGVDVPFGQCLVVSCLVEFNEADEGQITGRRVWKGIEDLAE